METEKTLKPVIESSQPQRVTIVVRRNGPYRVSGDFELVDAEGNPIAHGSPISLCRCGQSSNKPFCDGHHRTVGFVAE